ncbi:MAG: hypothetical protein ABJA93_14905 [Sporichthyaceae bacterium]
MRVRLRAAATVCVVGLVLGLVAAIGSSASAGQRPTWSTAVALPVPEHVDPAPPGVDVKHRMRTDELLARAAARSAVKATSHERGPRFRSSLRTAAQASLTTAAATGTAPAGVSALAGLTGHVEPSCSGNGSDGNRVRVLYVVEADDPDRFTSVLPILRDEVANVDDTFALSAAKDVGGLRVRWVSDPATCQPLIKRVTVKSGDLATFSTMIAAVKGAGYAATNRKYLMFADASVLCGVGHLILDDSRTGNANDGGRPMYARVDTGCWQAGSRGSTAAHELMHNLGGVQRSAANSTVNGHCTDDKDLMCYSDGAGVTMRQVCPAADEPLFDCQHNDYFATNPAAGSYLASKWNTATSSFLDAVAPLRPLGTVTPPPVPTTPVPTTPAPTTPAPTVAVAGPTEVRPGLPAAVAAAGSADGTYAWTLDKARCATGSTASATLTVQCPSYESGSVRATVTLTVADGRTASAVHVLALTGTTAPLTLTLTQSRSTSHVGQQVVLTTRVQSEALPVRGWVQIWSSTDGVTWRSIAGPGDIGIDGVYAKSVWPTRTTYYRSAVVTAADGGWTQPEDVTDSVRVTKWPVALAARARAGRPDVVTGHLTSAVSGRAVAGRRIVLQRRLAGASTWRTVGAAVTGPRGYVSERVQPRRHAYYRWVYAGTSSLSRTTSGSVYLRY